MVDQLWNREIARVWRNYVPPNRPSRFELELCSAEISRLRAMLRHEPRLLILGSTTEFRDWAYEEAVETTLIDSSIEYHNAVSAELTHFNPRETVVFEDWRRMNFVDEFDLVVGDLAVGQVPLADYPVLLERIHRALHPCGSFMTKSFFADPERPARDVGELLLELASEGVDPFPHVVYDLAMTCVGDDGVLRFVDMIEHIRMLAAEARATPAQLERFETFGWDATFKVNFTMPSVDRWERELAAYFPDFEKTADPARPHMDHIPMYTSRRRQ